MTDNLHLNDLKLTVITLLWIESMFPSCRVQLTVSLAGVKPDMWLTWAGQCEVMPAAHKTLAVF